MKNKNSYLKKIKYILLNCICKYIGTVFSQKLLTCDYPDKVDCPNTPRFYSSNENLVREQGNWVVRQQNQQQSNLNNDYGQRKIK